MAGKRRSFTSSTTVSADILTVWEFHRKPAALEKLSPTDMKVSVGDKDFTVIEGASLTIWMSPSRSLLRFPWVSKFVDVREPQSFTDIQTLGPFALWRHKHTFSSVTGGTLIEDSIEYAVPGWFIGDWLLGNVVAKQLESTFDYRRKLLSEHNW